MLDQKNLVSRRGRSLAVLMGVLAVSTSSAMTLQHQASFGQMLHKNAQMQSMMGQSELSTESLPIVGLVGQGGDLNPEFLIQIRAQTSSVDPESLGPIA